ncbi:MAG TPA: hypothetical protein VFD55_00500 [Candidatus Angelobacter sp.]|nr:hypothetical protein [Candidatus Angelobacter sp.]
MNKSITTKKSKAKKIILILTGIIVLTIVGFFASIPLFDKLDQNRFETLDAQIQGIFRKLQTASNNVDTWKYETICSANMSGWMPTGSYNCAALISLEKSVKSVQEINDLQAKYYQVIDNNDALEQKTDLDPQLPNDFGKKFVVSSAEKHYTEVKSGIECSYLIKLNQDKAKENTENSAYGSNIDDGIGSLRASLSCSETARGHWYDVDKITDTFTP